MRPVSSAIKSFCFEYFQVSSSAAVAAEAAREGKEAMAAAMKREL